MRVAPERLGLAELLVGLGHLHAAAEYVVFAGRAGEVDNLALGGDLRGLGPVGAQVALGRRALHDLVGAQRQLVGAGGRHVGGRARVPLGGDGLHHLAAGVVLAVDVGVLARGVHDVELGAVEPGVALGLVAGLGVLLGDLQAAFLPLEAHENLGAGARVDAVGGEARGHLVGALLDLAPGGAQELGLGPVLELGVRAVGRVAPGAQVGERYEHVARGLVLVVAPAAAVVPLVGEHRLVESGRAVAEPHCGDELLVAHAGLAVGAGRGGFRARVCAVGDLAVRVHAGGGVAGVGYLVADGHLDGLGRQGLPGIHHAHAQGERDAHQRSDHLGGHRGLGCSCVHLRLLRTGCRRARSLQPGATPGRGRASRCRRGRTWRARRGSPSTRSGCAPRLPLSARA